MGLSRRCSISQRLNCLRSVGLMEVIVLGPIATLIILALFIAFASWQWRVLTRPHAHQLFSSKPV